LKGRKDNKRKTGEANEKNLYCTCIVAFTNSSACFLTSLYADSQGNQQTKKILFLLLLNSSF
jgi:hypothetical protein